jgi:hypothetical protein
MAPATQISAADPAPREVYAALCKVTETLARELASPGQTAPDWSDYEWSVARAVAAMHGISPLLARSLHWRGPNAWVSFLDQQRRHTRARHSRMAELLQSIDNQAREAGLAVTALKGAALHRLNLYEPGDRPMADLDLLVRPADVQRAARLLSGLGFRMTEESWKERVFTPTAGVIAAALGEHSANTLKVEVHERICEKLPLRLIDVSEYIFPLACQPGLNDYPSKGSLMRHLLLHAAGSMAFQTLRILHVHDIGLLAASMGDADWREVISPSSVRPWWAYPPLELASRFHPRSVPLSVLAVLKSDCPRLLRESTVRRSLVEVSCSYLWVKAFPGIEWSQSLREMLQYALSRIRPTKTHLASRKVIAANQTWAKYGDWSNMSQARRIVRWLSSRQTRPATMHVVTAALSEI